MKANDTMHGGGHYHAQGKDLQHWDLSRMFKWDPMQYQIIKYVMRWKDKHATPEKRLEDLKKARHFLDKYIEDYADYDDHQRVEVPAPGEKIVWDHTKIYPDQALPLHPMQDPAALEVNTDWQCEGWYGDRTNLYRCKHCRSLIRTGTVDRAIELHGACPKGRGYVKQD